MLTTAQRAPKTMNNWPLIKKGVAMAMTMVINQLRRTAKLRPLSVIISAMYNQGMGPRENSKKTMNSMMKITQKI